MYTKMKSTIYALFLTAMLCVEAAHSQQFECFLRNLNDSVSLFSDYSDSIPFHTLFQDTIKENYYYLYLLESQGDRFRVRVEDCSHSTKTIGWIQKQHCTVWVWLMSSNSIYLFSDHNVFSNYQDIAENEMLKSAYGCYGEVLEILPNSQWVKISIDTKYGKVAGWTLNYCNNIYGECEGERMRPPSKIYSTK